MADVSETRSPAERYEIALFRLAAIDAGIYGARGRRYRPRLVIELAELRTQVCGRRAEPSPDLGSAIAGKPGQGYGRAGSDRH